MKRNLAVPNEKKALELMQAKLAEVFTESALEFADNLGEYSRKLFLMWFSRDYETDEWVGCPCFVCYFTGKKDGRDVQGIIYVKIFARTKEKMTQIYFVDRYIDYAINEIEEGERFDMHDECGRYEDESFVFLRGEIIPV